MYASFYFEIYEKNSYIKKIGVDHNLKSQTVFLKLTMIYHRLSCTHHTLNY